MTEMKPNADNETERMEDLLKAAIQQIAEDAAASRDLWPDVLRRMEREPVKVPWFDWALAVGLLALAALFPTAIPVFLYYL